MQPMSEAGNGVSFPRSSRWVKGRKGWSLATAAPAVTVAVHVHMATQD